MKTCYIVCAGDGFRPIAPTAEDLVIAADGGYRYLAAHGIRCDLFVGDFDSFAGNLPTGVPVERHPSRKDDSDAALAYAGGYARGYRNFVFLGATGGRPDHTFAMLQLLARIREEGADALLCYPTYDAFVLHNEERRVPGTIGKYLSVFAVGGIAEGVTLRGLSYPLDDVTLRPDVPLGLSNAFTAPEAEIVVRRGTLLVMKEC